MKTFLRIIFIISLTTACNEEEFYEKDFIETYKDQYDDMLEEQRQAEEEAARSNNGNDNNDSNTGVVDSGSDSGSGDDTIDPGYQIITQNDSFQVSGEKTPIDILWVIDNSGSMGNEQDALAYNFETFINEFIAEDVPFKMGITTTDARSGINGYEVPGSLSELTSEKMHQNQAKFVQNFKDMIRVGTRGSGNEKGIETSLTFNNRYAQNHFNPDSYFVVVYVSDEEDQSSQTTEEAFSELVKFKSKESLLKVYSIVNHSDPLATSRYHVNGHERYTALSTKSNGKSVDINGDFYSTLLEMAQNITTLSKTYALDKKVEDAQSVIVKINGVETTEFNFLESTNSIELLTQGLQVGDSVSVSYKTKVEVLN